MRLFVLMCLVGACSLVNGANLKECESYARAPKGLKAKTLELLSDGTSETVRNMRRKELAEYVDKAPLGSEDLVRYLEALSHDSLPGVEESVTNMAQEVINRYLMRPGNEPLAAKFINRFMEDYWLEFMFGLEPGRNERWETGFARAEAETAFIARLAKQYPKVVAPAWNNKLASHQQEILNIGAVLESLKKAEAYLRFYKTQSNDEIAEDNEFFEQGENVDKIVENRNRVNYVRDLIKELDHKPAAFDMRSMVKLYVLGEKPFPGNAVFEEDEGKWAGREIDFASATQVLVYLVRVSRQVGIINPEVAKVEESLVRLKALLATGYPRRL